jgi:hypothetical protein
VNLRRVLTAVAVLLAVGRLGLAFYSGTIFQTGGSDFEMNLPAGFLDRDQPPASSLSAALRDPWIMPAYPRGPSQYLALIPLALIGPYATLSPILLGVYTLLIVGLALLLWRIAVAVCGARVPWAWPLVATFCFTPVTDALMGREFEVVIAVAFGLAAWAIARDRTGTYGALLAYISLYKYLPLIAVPYLLVRRWWRAVAGFAVTAVLILGAAHLAFGLDRFSSNSIGGMAVDRLAGFGSTAAFCTAPVQVLDTREPSDDDDSVRVDLCRWSAYLPPPGLTYLLIVAGILAAAGYGTWRFERGGASVDAVSERWRRLLELSLIIVVSSTFFYSHYYYLALLIVPLYLVLVRLIGPAGWSPAGLACWVVAYFLLGRFLVPAFIIERVFGLELWEIYQATPARLIGELLLVGLILQQYVTLPITAAPAGTAALRPAVSPAGSPPV